jgi:hypothetical protein
MQHTCPDCDSVDITMTGWEEGWDAHGEHGIHQESRSYRCRQCGHNWTRRTDKASPEAGRADL